MKADKCFERKVPSEELFSQEKQVAMLQNWMKAKGYEAVGSLILYSSGVTGVDNDRKPIIDNRIMVQ